MMEMVGRAIVEERLGPRQFAELAAYVRQEYGPGNGPGFLIAAAIDGARKRPKRREAVLPGVIRALAKGVKALVPGIGKSRKANDPNPTR